MAEENTIELDNSENFGSPSKFDKTVLASSSDDEGEEEYNFDSVRNVAVTAEVKYQDLET